MLNNVHLFSTPRPTIVIPVNGNTVCGTAVDVIDLLSVGVKNSVALLQRLYCQAKGSVSSFLGVQRHFFYVFLPKSAKNVFCFFFTVFFLPVVPFLAYFSLAACVSAVRVYVIFCCPSFHIFLWVSISKRLCV